MIVAVNAVVNISNKQKAIIIREIISEKAKSEFKTNKYEVAYDTKPIRPPIRPPQ